MIMDIANRQNKTIVTAFFDINRENWSSHQRSLQKYLQMGEKNIRIDENMIIFIEEKFSSFIKEVRKAWPNKTLIIATKLSDLPKYKIRPRIKEIMESAEFKNDLSEQGPPVTQPDYDVIMWSKTDLMKKAIELNPFNSTHFAWLDFGMAEYAKVEDFPGVFSDKVRLLCISMPHPRDLERVRNCKRNSNRFAGGFYTGRIDYLLKFIEKVDKEIDTCLALNVVHSDETMYSNVYIQSPDLFELYKGYWRHVYTNYHKVVGAH